MKQLYRFLLLLGFALVVGVKANAQRVSFVEPKEDTSLTVSPNRVKIVVHSNSDKMEMSHNMGEERGAG